MFAGVTLATVLADAVDVMTEFLPLLTVLVGFWGAIKVRRLIGSFLGG